MMKSKSTSTSTLLVVVALLFAGCTHTRTVYPTDPADRSVASINRLARKNGRLLVSLDDRSVYVVQLRMGPDSTSWVSDRFEVVATDRIQRISMVDSGHGYLIGAALGGLFGGALAVGGLVAVGGVFGGLMGRGARHEHIYEFEAPPVEPVLAGGGIRPRQKE